MLTFVSALFIMKLIKIQHKDEKSADSIVERKSLFGDKQDADLVSAGEGVWNSFSPFRRRRARVTRFIYEDQWGDMITVNGKTMTQREYLISQGNVALQANLMASKANSIVGAHIKEGAVPSLHARKRSEQALGEVLSETLKANWDDNDENELEANWEFELLTGGLAVCKEELVRVSGQEEVRSRAVNPNMFAFQSSMQDPRLADISMTVELHDYTFNDLCASFAEDEKDFEQLREWYNEGASPLRYKYEVDPSEKTDEARTMFRYPEDPSMCRVIEIWTKERRPRYHVHDQQTAELYDINADDKDIIRQIKATNKARQEEGRRLGFADDEIPVIELHYFIDTFYYVRFLTPTGYILFEGESELPDRSLPYTICATPLVNGKICGFLADAVDLQMAINRELVIYDWMKRLDTKGVTFVPQDIIPDGMSYSEFAEQWTSMDGIIFYKPNRNGDKPFVEHSNMGSLNTAEMVKMLADTMAESVSVSGAIQGKTPYAGTSAQLYAQQKENSTTPMAVIMGKLDTFIKHVAIKKTQFIQMYYTLDRFEDVVDGMDNIEPQMLDLSRIVDIQCRFKYVLGPDKTTLRQGTNELLLSLMQMGAMNAVDVLQLGEFDNADAIIEKLTLQAQQMAAEQQAQQIAPDYESKRQAIATNR